MRALLLLVPLLAVACAPQSWAALDHELAELPEGSFRADYHLDVFVKLGPVRVARERCDERSLLLVDAAADPVVSGSVTCELPEVGTVTAEVRGDVSELPFLLGVVEAEDMEMPWEGGFTSSEGFFGEVSGTAHESGFTIRWSGWFEATRAVGSAG